MDAHAGLGLDPWTLLFSISMSGFLMAGISISSSKAMLEQKAALVEWSRAMAMAGAGGFVVFFLRGQMPWRDTFVAANMLLVMTAAWAHLAFSRLLALTPQRSALWALSSFAYAGVAASYAFDAAWPVAIFSLSVGVSAVLGMTARAVATAGRGRGRTWTESIAATFFGLMSGAFAVRAAISAWGDAALLSPESGSRVQVTALLGAGLFIVATSVCFFSLVHERQRQAAIESARRDGLTGVRTRKAFFELAAEARKAWPTRIYAVVMVDVDHFKKINDTYGHGGGDVTLSHVARLIAGAVRISDIVGRYGGEEFCVLLHDCDEQQAAALSQRLVHEADGQRVRLADGRTVTYTLSAGYAVGESPADSRLPPETLDEVIERADQALYRAKRQGRNQAQPASPRDAAAAQGPPLPHLP